MHKLGLVCGTGPESSLIYYREINSIIYQKTSGVAYPEFNMENVNMNKALGLLAENDRAGLTNYLLDAITKLAKGGAEFAALTANTLHIVFEELQRLSPIPLISIIETVCDEAMSRGYKKIGLLGTYFTMTESFFMTPFAKRGIQIVTPSAKGIELVSDRIKNELEFGVVTEKTTDELISVIKEMQKCDGIDAVILGCTELPLALNKDNCPLPCLDTMSLHIDKLVSRILE